MCLEKNLKLLFNSNLTDVVSCNDSFDAGVLYIAYHGENRNRSSISKEVFEKCASTMYNVPVVANYIREDDTLGGHDMAVVRKDGRPTLVNLTQPVGVVPESANYWWETVTEEDGTEHEYLCADVLLWKRQEAYATIKENGVTSESMEIAVKSGKMNNGVYEINDFQFLAFCLLGDCEPCFESAALATFSSDAFTAEFRAMLNDLPSVTKKFKEEVSNKAMNRKLKLLAQYGLTIDDLDFELAEFSIEELKEKFEAIKKKFEDESGDGAEGEGSGESGADGGTAEAGAAEDEVAGGGPSLDDLGDLDNPTGQSEQPETPATPAEPTGDGEGGGEGKEPEPAEGGEGQEDDEDDEVGQAPRRVGFALDSELRKELRCAVGKDTFVDEWGDTCSHYWVIDYDVEQKLVYCVDCKCGGIIVRMNWEHDGDSVVVDFDSAVRVKPTFVDYVEGTAGSDQIGEAMQSFSQEKVKAATSKFNAEKEELEAELESLRAFKAEADKVKRSEDEAALFETFSDLNGVAEFDALRSDCAGMELGDIEEKCFAIRGRQINFSVKPKKKHNTVLPVESVVAQSDDEPYGNVFEKYGARR